MKTFALHADADQFADANWASASRGEADFCSKEGALALKEKIETYWRERGQNVMLSLHNVGFHPAIRAARFDVRSDMVNGMPRAGVAAGTPRTVFDPPAEAEYVDVDDFESDLAFE